MTTSEGLRNGTDGSQCFFFRNKKKIVLTFKKLTGSCVVFLVHGTILRQWTSLLNNSASIEERKKSWPWLLKNRASHCWRIVPVTVEESCQRLLNNCVSDCWILVPATDEQACQWLSNNQASDCWTVMPVTVE